MHDCIGIKILSFRKFNSILSAVTQEHLFESEYRAAEMMAEYTEELRALHVSVNLKHIGKTPAI